MIIIYPNNSRICDMCGWYFNEPKESTWAYKYGELTNGAEIELQCPNCNKIKKFRIKVTEIELHDAVIATRPDTD